MADESRRRRIADNIHVTVARLLERRIKDPRLGFVTVTEVRVTGDLQHATIFYTVMGSDSDRAASAAALESAKGLIRSEVGKSLGIRLTPSLEFVPDALPASAAAMEEALSAARKHDEEVAKLAATASYAGEADPYRKPREVEEDFEEDFDEDFEEDFEDDFDLSPAPEEDED